MVKMSDFFSIANVQIRKFSLLLAGLVTVAVLFVGHAHLALADPVFPKLSGRVVDGANMLGQADRQLITEQLAQLEEKSTDQLVLVTLPSLQGYDIADFGVRLARHWQIGQRDKNNGVLLIVAPKDRKVRIEVGYGLEGTLTDTLAGNIVHNRILPLFRKGDMPEGIRRGITDIIDVLTGDAAGVAQRAKGKRRSSKGELDLTGLFILGLWAFMFFGGIGRAIFGAGRGGVIIVPVGEATSHWSGGRGGGGFGGGGGGFSGGGGSFGGGGSSGGW